MKTRSEDHEVLVRFLLGELSEAEQARIEQLFFTDEDYFEHLLAVEDELRYDYVQGRLSPAHREKFTKRFLTSPSSRDSLGIPESVMSRLSVRKAGTKDDAARQLAVGYSAHRPAGIAWVKLGSHFTNLIAANPMFASTAFRWGFASAAIIVVAGFALMIQLTISYRGQVDQLRRDLAQQKAALTQTEDEKTALAQELEHVHSERLDLENELAKRNKPADQVAEQSQPSGAVVSFMLSPGLTRDSGALKRITIPPGTAHLRLQLGLREPDDYSRYRAVLRTAEGKEVWRSGNLRAIRSSPLPVTLPAAVLRPGDYEMELIGLAERGQPESVDSYYFTVARE
jgi:hypothetical protein